MYVLLLTLHSLLRWAVLGGLLLGLARAGRGWLGRRPFTGFDNGLRHWAATLAHLQLMLGYALYFSSPLVASFRQSAATEPTADARFFGLLHVLLMTAAVVVLTIGSALARRRPTDAARFRTMALWFLAALLIILVAIPWPFSPLASRPLLRF